MILGLAYLHDRGIIHRDLKGDNVFMDAALKLKIGDFGSSIRMSTAKTIVGEINEFIGTVAYMAPEVITVRMHAFSTFGKNAHVDLHT